LGTRAASATADSLFRKAGIDSQSDILGVGQKGNWRRTTPGKQKHQPPVQRSHQRIKAKCVLLGLDYVAQKHWTLRCLRHLLSLLQGLAVHRNARSGHFHAFHAGNRARGQALREAKPKFPINDLFHRNYRSFLLRAAHFCGYDSWKQRNFNN
jgi:hypothetical protein